MPCHCRVEEVRGRFLPRPTRGITLLSYLGVPLQGDVTGPSLTVTIVGVTPVGKRHETSSDENI